MYFKIRSSNTYPITTEKKHFFRKTFCGKKFCFLDKKKRSEAVGSEPLLFKISFKTCTYIIMDDPAEGFVLRRRKEVDSEKSGGAAGPVGQARVVPRVASVDDAVESRLGPQPDLRKTASKESFHVLLKSCS